MTWHRRRCVDSRVDGAPSSARAERRRSCWIATCITTTGRFAHHRSPPAPIGTPSQHAAAGETPAGRRRRGGARRWRDGGRCRTCVRWTENSPKSVARQRKPPGPHESGELTSCTRASGATGAATSGQQRPPPSKSLRGTRYRCTARAAIPGQRLCSRRPRGFAQAAARRQRRRSTPDADAGPRSSRRRPAPEPSRTRRRRPSPSGSRAPRRRGDLEERELVRQAAATSATSGARGARGRQHHIPRAVPPGGHRGPEEAARRAHARGDRRADPGRDGERGHGAPAGGRGAAGGAAGRGAGAVRGDPRRGPRRCRNAAQACKPPPRSSVRRSRRAAAGLPFNIADVMGAQFEELRLSAADAGRGRCAGPGRRRRCRRRRLSSRMCLRSLARPEAAVEPSGRRSRTCLKRRSRSPSTRPGNLVFVSWIRPTDAHKLNKRSRRLLGEREAGGRPAGATRRRGGRGTRPGATTSPPSRGTANARRRSPGPARRRRAPGSRVHTAA